MRPLTAKRVNYGIYLGFLGNNSGEFTLIG